MRNFGGILLLLGVLGFFYASSQLGQCEPAPEGLGIRESLQYPAARWELVRYGCGGAAAVGLLMALFPKGR